MPRRIREDVLREIEAVLRPHSDGLTAQQIADALESAPPRRTLQYRLKSLVTSKRLAMEGTGRWARYRVPRAVSVAAEVVAAPPSVSARLEVLPALSEPAAAIREHVRQPTVSRTPTGYDREFLESYRPNETFYLSESERELLHGVGKPEIPRQQPAGTYAKHLLNRLLLDLSWNSSRLEGNTYSLLDTKRLIELGENAEGKQRHEAQMILNHKAAIEFLVSSAGEIDFNRYIVLNLHALLADNLLGDPAASGRLRRIAVGIEGSVFHPLEVPQLIQECFDHLLATSSAIVDPFEQALFVLVQLPYLQPFDDVNKRVSRLAANIPFIKSNLSPLSFGEVSRELYADATLGVYELRRVELMREVFIWAYKRSAAHYAAVRQSLGEPDPFRMRYRTLLHEVVGAVVRGRMDQKYATAHVTAWSEKHVAPPDRPRFCEIAERELLSLHKGNFARYRVRPSEFAAWQETWNTSG